MHLSAVCALSLFLPGVDAGWTPHPDGGLEYIIQIEPELVERLSSGQGISSEMPSLPLPIRRFRFQVGDGPLPRDLGPAVTVVVPGAIAPAAAPGVKLETSAARPVQGGLVQPPIPDPHASVAAERAAIVPLPEKPAAAPPVFPSAAPLNLGPPPGAPIASIPEKSLASPPAVPLNLGPPPGAPAAADAAAAAEKVRAEQWAAQRAAAEKADAEKAEAARLEAERKAAEKRQLEKKAAEAAAAERAASERAASERASSEAAESSSLDRRGTTRMRTPIGPMEVPRSLLGGGTDLARGGMTGPSLGAADSGLGSRGLGSFPPATRAAPSLAGSPEAAPEPSAASTPRTASASSGTDSAATNPFALIALVGSLGLNGFLGWVVHQHRSRAALVRRWKEDRSPPPPAPSESIF